MKLFTKMFKKDFAKKPQILCKAQIAITDLFIALFIATLLIISIISVWNRYTVLAEDNVNYNDLQISAFQTANILVKSKGKPSNWEEDPDNVEMIGLASSDRNLSRDKTNAFINLPYSTLSKLLGLELYDFYFAIMSLDMIPQDIGEFMEERDLLIAYYQKETHMDEEMQELLEEFLIDFYYKNPDNADPCLYPCLGKEEFLGNLSKGSYDLVLLEDPHFKYDNELEVVEDWVADGGWLFISEHMDRTSLGITYTHRGQNEKEDVDNITIINTDPYLNLELEDSLYPEEVPYVEDTFIPEEDELDAVNYITIGEYEDGTDGIARWEYGNGTAYYFSDFWIQEHSLPIDFPEIIGEAMKEIIGYIGGGEFVTILSYGLEEPQGKDVVSVWRYGFYENGTAILVFKLWK